MGSLTFVGLGLYDEYGLSLIGLEKTRQTQKVYVERYTSLMPDLSLKNLEKLLGKPLLELTRKDLEENAEETILKDAEKTDVTLLVPGDPMVATTHIALLLKAHEMGIKTHVVNGVSIYSAIPSVTGLQIYKFGRTVTIPFPTETYEPQIPYEVIEENDLRSLHTLILLDIDAEKKRYMTIREGIEYLLKIEEKRRRKVVTSDRLVVGVAGVGSPNPTVKGGRIKEIINAKFENLPHTLVFPGKLHFMEAKTLQVFANVPPEVLEVHGN